MAGYIELSNSSGISLSSNSFDEITERIREKMINNQSNMTKIYEPLDEGALQIISLEEQDKKGFNIFYYAACEAFEEYEKEQFNSERYSLIVKSWNELINLLKQDDRFNKIR
jgi:hypothetical protein